MLVGSLIYEKLHELQSTWGLSMQLIEALTGIDEIKAIVGEERKGKQKKQNCLILLIILNLY